MTAQKKDTAYFQKLLEARKAGKPAEVIQINTEAPSVPVTAAAQLAAVKAEAAQQQKESDEKALRQLIADIGKVAINQYGKLVVLTTVAGRFGALSLDSQQADDIIQANAAKLGKSIGKDKRNSEKERLRGQAILDGSKVSTFVRVAEIDGCHYHDLAGGDMTVIRAGGWHVEKNTHVPFSLVGGALPTPIKPDSLSSGYNRICAFLRRAGVADNMHLIVIVVLIEWLRSSTAYPLLDIIGPSGGGKTTLALLLINLIDPATDWKIGETRLNEEDVAAVAHIRHALLVDNTSSLSQEVQNLCCRICYGTVLMAREYYGQDTVFQVKVHSPIIVASINPAITNPDLIARTVRVPFKQRQNGYVSELEIRRQYAADRPHILGALYELFSEALLVLPDVVEQRVWKHRLVDFAQMGEAVAQTIGMEPGTFVKALDVMRQGVASDIVEGDGFVTAVMDFLKIAAGKASVQDKIPPYKSWEKAPGWSAIKSGNVVTVATKTSALLDFIKLRAAPDSLNYGRIEKWCPENARALTSILNIKLPLLADLKVKARNQPDFGGKKNGAWLFAFRVEEHD